MKHKRFSCEQIIGILEEADAGAVVLDLRRKPGMSSATFHAWKSKYSGLKVANAKRLGGLEEDSSKLKRLLAEAMLDNAAADSHSADPPGQARAVERALPCRHTVTEPEARPPRYDRAHKSPYEHSAGYRVKFNRCPIHKSGRLIARREVAAPCASRQMSARRRRREHHSACGGWATFIAVVCRLSRSSRNKPGSGDIDGDAA